MYVPTYVAQINSDKSELVWFPIGFTYGESNWNARYGEFIVVARISDGGALQAWSTTPPYRLKELYALRKEEGTNEFVRYKTEPNYLHFQERKDALDYASNWFFEQCLSPMQAFADVLSKSNPRRYEDLKGRKIPARYLKGLPKKLQARRVKELTQSRDAYRAGDYSELATDRAARKLGLVKKSAYSIVAERRGIEWRGDALDMARRVLKKYGSRTDPSEFAAALQMSYNKGLAAWKSGGHRPGATAQNWAVARVASLVVGGKTAWTADKKQFSVLPPAVQKKIMKGLPEVYRELEKQSRKADVSAIKKAAKANPHPHDGASVLVMDPRGRVLMLRRSATDPWKPGYWNLPGGRIDKGETPLQAAKRELAEETSLFAYDLKSIGSIKAPEGWTVHYFLAQPGAWDGRIRLDRENNAYFWSGGEDYHRLDLIPTVHEALEQIF